jgi:hypothetical protein
MGIAERTGSGSIVHHQAIDSHGAKSPQSRAHGWPWSGVAQWLIKHAITNLSVLSAATYLMQEASNTRICSYKLHTATVHETAAW